MSTLERRNWLKECPYVLLGILFILFLGTHSPNIEYDIDSSYIMFGQARPPIYPLFIWLFHWLGHYQFHLIMWVQSIFTFSALMYSRHWLKKNLQIPDFLIFLVLLVVTITICFQFQICSIQSEGLAFPLFIFSFFALIECFQKFDVKKLLYLAILVSLLVLTRLQFFYFYGIFIILLVWYVWQRTPIKSLSATALILFSSIFLSIITDHSYHYFKHRVHTKVYYVSSMVLAQALYLADDNAADYFNNPTEKNYVQNMIIQRNAQGLNQDAALMNDVRPSYLEYAYQSYSRNYLALQKIINETISLSEDNFLGKVNISESNAIALNIDKVLLSHALKKNIAFFIWKFVDCMGGVPLLLFFSIILLVLPFKIMKEKILHPHNAVIFVGVVTLITCLNAGIIALCSPDLPVYFCYSQFMFYCLAALLGNISFNKNMYYVKSSLTNPSNRECVDAIFSEIKIPN